jgi:antitoxin Xre/MbcA/ParS-like protein
MATATVIPLVTLQELHDPETGRLDASRVAEYLKVPLRQLAGALNKNYSTVHKTPSAPSLQPALYSIKRILEILEQVFVDRPAVLAWLNSPHPDLGRRTALEVILQGYPDAVEDMLEAALTGTPS